MKFLIIAGEESGEIYSARLMREIKKQNPGAEFAGIGGDRMAAEGMSLLHHVSEMASIGLLDMLKNLSRLLGILNQTRGLAAGGKFDAVILIDYPDFNLRVARAASEAGVPVFYYVCPQFWSWRTYRVNACRKWVDTMLVALPFEEGFYQERGVNARFIGHPMLDEIGLFENREEIRKELMPDGASELIGILPGSRKSEVGYMLEPLVQTADEIHAKKPSVGFAIAAAPHIPAGTIEAVVGGRNYIKVISGDSHRLMAASDLLITKSGTSTLEAAIIGTPMIIVYRLSWSSYIIAWFLTHGHYAGLPNIIADKEIAPEFMQRDFHPRHVADAAVRLLENRSKLEDARNEMAEVKNKLGGKGASNRAAEYIVRRLEELKAKK